MAVLTVLRNRVYLGEVFFRDTYHPAPHPPLIDPETFDLAGQILRLRGEEYAHRASNASDYLLAGLITCTHCGKRYIGTAAHGNKYRYRYYTCFSRHRYGTATCPAERLPADQLESEVRGSLLRTISRHDLLDAALAAGLARSGAKRRQHQDELKVVEVELTKAEEPLSDTSSPSRPAPCLRPPAGNASRPSAERSLPSKTGRASWPHFSKRSESPPSPRPISTGSVATLSTPSRTAIPKPRRDSFKRWWPESKSKAVRRCARTSGYRSMEVA